MSLLSTFYPDAYLSSVYTMDFNALYAKGYRGIIFDIDNTLVPHGAPADDRSKKLFKMLRDIGFSTLLLSNNKEPRVKSFSESVGADGYIYKGNKPSKKGYFDAMEHMGTKPSNTLLIGDQIFTDVWGARRVGIYGIMVAPVQKWREEPQIILKRIPEALVLWSFRRFKRAALDRRGQ